ncbi:MAG TPA: hypothetical protein VL944_01715 [Candidatus Acidoferrum sp.]|nr:hypothetical protein [Candidatus Acidoferrum sp.]
MVKMVGIRNAVREPNPTVSMVALNSELFARLQTSTDGATTLADASHRVVGVLRGFREERSLERLGFVAAIRESDGVEPEKIELNELRLAGYVNSLRLVTPFPLFSCLDIYTPRFLANFYGENSVEAWDKFWKDIFKPKEITDLFLTPRWEQSYGARFERKLAEELDLKVHYVDRDPALLRILRLVAPT